MIPPYELISSARFDTWLESLPLEVRSKVLAKVRQLSLGNESDAKPVGSGVRELRIHSGPGFRVYFKRVDPKSILLLAGGDKSGQRADIARAIALVKTHEQHI